MDDHKGQAKLTRTQSSLLRSLPTFRPPASEISQDLEERKPHSKHRAPRFRSNAARFRPVVTLLFLSAYTIFAFVVWDDSSTSENLLISMIFVAVFLFSVSRNKDLVKKSFSFCKQFVDEHGKRLGLSCFPSKSNTKSVQWFIGDPSTDEIEGKQQSIDFGQVTREGVEFYSNGDFYEGEFHMGRCNGSGVYNYVVKGRYEGDWVDGRYDGYGIESWARGSRYKGQYRHGLRHGYGVYRFYTGDTYAGEWCNGQSHGIGVQSCTDGSCYIGEFKCGVKHGLGCYHFRNGDRYGGEYFRDKIHGFGVYHFVNGHCYEGSWHEGRRQGFGMYTFENGETRYGEWDSGHLQAPHFRLTDSLLRAVQGARKSAENAVGLRQVDEKLSKAVAAANWAAMAARVAAIKAVQNRIHRQFCDGHV